MSKEILYGNLEEDIEVEVSLPDEDMVYEGKDEPTAKTIIESLEKIIKSVLDNGVNVILENDYEHAYYLLNEKGNVLCIDLSEYKKVNDDNSEYACAIFEYGNSTPTVLFNTKLTGSEIYKLLNIDTTFFTKSVENESGKKYMFVTHQLTYGKDWQNYKYSK